MAFELDSEIRSRLIRHYQQISDEELLELSERPKDLTDTAQEVLRAEMQSRRLDPQLSTLSPAPFQHSQINAVPTPTFGVQLERGQVSLITFFDALRAGEACNVLDEAEISFAVKDRSQPQSGMRSFDDMPVALELIVDERDRDSAVKLLREKMGLFPIENIAEPDAPIDDGTVATVGQFARRSDAEEVARVLTDANIWNRITANPDGSAATEDAFLVEVREVDLFRAGELVEKALNLPEV